MVLVGLGVEGAQESVLALGDLSVALVELGLALDHRRPALLDFVLATVEISLPLIQAVVARVLLRLDTLLLQAADEHSRVNVAQLSLLLVQLRRAPNKLGVAGVELSLLGFERLGLEVQGRGTAVEIRLLAVEGHVAGVERGLALIELLGAGVELGLALIELLGAGVERGLARVVRGQRHRLERRAHHRSRRSAAGETRDGAKVEQRRTQRNSSHLRRTLDGLVEGSSRRSGRRQGSSGHLRQRVGRACVGVNF